MKSFIKKAIFLIHTHFLITTIINYIEEISIKSDKVSSDIKKVL